MISIIAFIWNGLGVLNFVTQLDAVAVSQLPELQRTIIESRPTWAFAFFGLAVFTGMFGSLFLLLKKSIAYKFFIVSLITVIVQAIPYIGIDTETSFVFILIMILLQILFSAFLIWYTNFVINKEWLKS